MANGYFERGEIYKVRMDYGLGAEEGAFRPGLIVSNTSLNCKMNVVVVAYISRKSQGRIISNWDIEVFATGTPSFVMCNQVACVDKSRLMGCMGKLDAAEQRKVDDTLEEMFDLGYVDDTLIKAKDSEIADRDIMISDLRNEVAGVKAEVGKKDEEIASLKMEIEMWQKCYGRCMDMLVDTKVAADLSRRTARVEEPVEKVDIVEEPAPLEPPKEPEPVVEETRLDINSCTATALKKAGFSMAVARKIVESRPFESVEDLKRVNGIKSTLYTVISPRLCANKPVLKSALVEPDPGYEVEDEDEKININTATGRELKDKLGINECYAYSITSHRNKNGPYTSLEELKNVKGVSKVFYEKYKDRLTVA
jgi:competence ComEA-like helix-hairpin-helix protein